MAAPGRRAVKVLPSRPYLDPAILPGGSGMSADDPPPAIRARLWTARPGDVDNQPANPRVRPRDMTQGHGPDTTTSLPSAPQGSPQRRHQIGAYPGESAFLLVGRAAEMPVRRGRHIN